LFTLSCEFTDMVQLFQTTAITTTSTTVNFCLNI